MSAPVAPSGVLDRLDGIALPTRRDESWRYAPHRLLGELTFGTSPAAVTAGRADLDLDLDECLPVLDGPRIVVVNGVVDRDQSDLAGAAGVSIATLADALAERSELVGVRTERSDESISDAFMALNLAHGVDGVVISVDRGVTLDTPIHIVDIAAPTAETNTSCSGVIIDIGAASNVTVVESRIGVGTQFGGSNVRTSITVGDDTTLDHIVIQDLPAEQVHLSAVEISQGERSTVNARSFNLGAAYGRLEYVVELAGAGARHRSVWAVLRCWRPDSRSADLGGACRRGLHQPAVLPRRPR